MKAKWYSGNLGASSFPTFVLQVRKNPEKTSPRKLVQTGDRTRARCVTGARATTCSTAVDILAYADGVDIIARSQSALKGTFITLEESARKMNLRIDKGKTKYKSLTKDNRYTYTWELFLEKKLCHSQDSNHISISPYWRLNHLGHCDTLTD